jgi:hypothetical protein
MTANKLNFSFWVCMFHVAILIYLGTGMATYVGRRVANILQ